MHDIREGLGIFPDRRNISNASDINAAVAYKNTDLRFLSCKINFRREFLGPGLSASGGGQYLS